LHSFGFLIFADVEIDNYRRIVRANLVYGLHDATETCKNEKIDLSEIKDLISFVDEIRPRAVDLSNPEVKQNLIDTYNNPKIKKAIFTHKPVELSIEPENLTYFYDNFERISSEDYIPTNEDILRCRQRTAGAGSTTIYINKVYFEFTDVGGQKPEQAKWLQIIKENQFAAVLFFVASDEFNVKSSEDPERTKVAISRKIFSEVCNNDYIGDATPVVLFLNRRDLFGKKISDDEHWNAFRKIFPDYTGQQTEEEALEYLGYTFTKVLEQSHSDRIVNVHFTCALDTKAMGVVWDTVREAVLRQLLTKIGIV